MPQQKPPSKTQAPLSDALRQQAIDWLLRMQASECTATERGQFKRWLQQHPSHAEAYHVVSNQWDWLEQFKSLDIPARQAALQYRKPVYPRVLRYAAVCGLLALGVTAYVPNGWLGVSTTYVAQKGEQQTVTLADGSTLELNTDTQVRVHFDYWQRQVELIRGEAFFSVQHDAQRPFEVLAGQGRIRDIGTAFNVYREAERVTVLVQEGSVDITATGNRQLSAGQQISYNGLGEFESLPEPVSTNLTAWRKGQWVFRNRRLDEVLKEIERYHTTRIRLQDNSLAALRMSGTFHLAKLDDMLAAITTLLPIHVERIGGQEIVLKEKGKKS